VKILQKVLGGGATFLTHTVSLLIGVLGVNVTRTINVESHLHLGRTCVRGPPHGKRL